MSYPNQESILINYINEKYDPKSFKTERCKRIALGKIVTSKITGRRKLICYDLLNCRIIEKVLN